MAAVLPALLPTPPKSQMLPLLPTPCLIILSDDFVPPSLRPGRADAVERWDEIKKLKLSSAAAAPSSSSHCRADAVDRWDANKKLSNSNHSPVSSSSSSKGRPGRADAVQKWDANKKIVLSTASPAPVSSSASTCERWGWDSNKTKKPDGTGTSPTPSKRAIGQASSAERWDIHKKPPPQKQDGGGCDQSVMKADTNVEAKMEASNVEVGKPPPAVFWGGTCFFQSPAPSMLPMPSFLGAH